MLSQQIEGNLQRFEAALFPQKPNKRLNHKIQLFLVDGVPILIIRLAKQPQIDLPSHTRVTLAQQPHHTSRHSQLRLVWDCFALERNVLVKEVEPGLDGEDVGVFDADYEGVHDEFFDVGAPLCHDLLPLGFGLSLFNLLSLLSFLYLGRPFLRYGLLTVDFDFLLTGRLIPERILIIVLLLMHSFPQFRRNKLQPGHPATGRPQHCNPQRFRQHLLSHQVTPRHQVQQPIHPLLQVLVHLVERG